MKAHEDFLEWSELQHQLQLLNHAFSHEDLNAIKGVLHTCVHGFHEQMPSSI